MICNDLQCMWHMWLAFLTFWILCSYWMMIKHLRSLMNTFPFGLEDAHCATGPTSTTVSSTFRIAFMDLLLNFLHFHCRQKEKQNWRMGWCEFAEPHTFGPNRRPEGEEVAINCGSGHIGHSKFAKANLGPYQLDFQTCCILYSHQKEGASKYSRS